MEKKYTATNKLIVLCSLSLLLLTLPLQLKSNDWSQFPYKKQQPDFKLTIRSSFNPALSIYKPNPNFMGSSKALQGLGFSIKTEMRFKKRATTRFLTGLEYYKEGIRFNGYYFAQGHSSIYDGNLNYSHKLSFNEMFIPFLVKQNNNDEDQNQNSFYFMAGWGLRINANAKTEITQNSNGTVIYSDQTKIIYEHPLIGKSIGSTLLLGAGYEYKLPEMKNGIFFEGLFHFNLTRVKYKGNGTSNDITFSKHTFGIGIGFEF